MGITYGDHLIDSGHYEMTPEQEREIVEDRMCDSVADDLRQCANEPWKYDGGSWPDKMIAGVAEIDRLRSDLTAKDARVAELEANVEVLKKHCYGFDVYKRAFERGSKVAEAVTNATSLEETQIIAQEWLDE